MRMCPISTSPLWKAEAESSAGREMGKCCSLGGQAASAEELGDTSKKQPLLESSRNILYQKKNNAKMCLDC